MNIILTVCSINEISNIKIVTSFIYFGFYNIMSLCECMYLFVCVCVCVHVCLLSQQEGSHT